MSKFIPRRLECAVVSGGGVASSLLGQFLGRRHVVNDPSDVDGFKHMPVPSVSFNPRFCYVFVFGDPVAATISLFRRGYHCLQSRKLQRGYKPYRPIPLDMSLEQYAALGEDRFHFERQFLNFSERHLIHSTLFLRYETLWENLEPLRAFLGLDPTEMASFPPRRERAPVSVAHDVVKKLAVIYRPFIERLESLPDAFVRGKPLSWASLFFTKNFRLAVRNGIVSRFKPVTGPYGE